MQLIDAFKIGLQKNFRENSALGIIEKIRRESRQNRHLALFFIVLTISVVTPSANPCHHYLTVIDEDRIRQGDNEYMAKYTHKKISAKLAGKAVKAADDVSPEDVSELQAIGEDIRSLGRRTNLQAYELGGYLARELAREICTAGISGVSA